MAPTKRNLNECYLKEVRRNLGNVCVNCGSTEGIEYHHIVPLFLGGREVQSNIVPLCYKCHKAAHHGRHLSKYRDQRNKGGRKPNVSDEEAFSAFDLFASGKIGKKKCIELLGLSKSTHITDVVQYRKYLNAKGIESIKNKVDILGTNGTLKSGVNVGIVKYKDGTTKIMIYEDNGENDIEYKIKRNVKIY